MNRIPILALLGVLIFSSGLVAESREMTIPFSAKVLLAPLRFMTKAAADGSFGWKVGDTLNYQMRMKPLPFKGTNTISVTQDAPEGYWLTEVVQFKSFKQTSQVLLDKDTGQIKKIIANGKTQGPPDAGQMNVVKVEEAHITVPAGSFDCVHMVVEDADQNQTEQWVNPRDLPISGMIKSVSAEAGVLEVDTELTSFERGK